jgi:hypothetical protein
MVQPRSGVSGAVAVGMNDLDALAHLARRYCVVTLTVSDCGCHTVELFVEGQKICEEDKDLSAVIENVRRRITEIESRMNERRTV